MKKTLNYSKSLKMCFVGAIIQYFTWKWLEVSMLCDDGDSWIMATVFPFLNFKNFQQDNVPLYQLRDMTVTLVLKSA